ncbi:MAG: hypothetical protein R3330_17845, partial [Saprospiraceae bacterium]|nr:hypothetical protein [Saprospiraceae bacterium]
MEQQLTTTNKTAGGWMHLSLLATIMIVLLACGGDAETTDQTTTDTPAKTAVQVPPFNRDSAYAFVARQVSFGPRAPGSPG